MFLNRSVDGDKEGRCISRIYGIRASRPAADRALFATPARRSRSPLKRSPPPVTIASRKTSGSGSTGPRCHEGQPLAHPAGWSPDMGASSDGDAGLYLSDGPVYWPLPSPQGHRGSPDFPPSPWRAPPKNRHSRSPPPAVASRSLTRCSICPSRASVIKMKETMTWHTSTKAEIQARRQWPKGRAERN